MIYDVTNDQLTIRLLNGFVKLMTMTFNLTVNIYEVQWCQS